MSVNVPVNRPLLIRPRLSRQPLRSSPVARPPSLPRRFRAEDYLPPGLEGSCRKLAVGFWITLAITMLIVAGLVTVTTGSQIVTGLCADACVVGYRMSPVLLPVLRYTEPVLILLALVAWLMGRRPPRRTASRLFAVLLVLQLGLAGLVCYGVYSLTTR